jgi:hypothetical protein
LLTFDKQLNAKAILKRIISSVELLEYYILTFQRFTSTAVILDENSVKGKEYGSNSWAIDI